MVKLSKISITYDLYRQLNSRAKTRLGSLGWCDEIPQSFWLTANPGRSSLARNRSRYINRLRYQAPPRARGCNNLHRGTHGTAPPDCSPFLVVDTPGCYHRFFVTLSDSFSLIYVSSGSAKGVRADTNVGWARR